jgi:isopentenyldiphosphate isomerase
MTHCHPQPSDEEELRKQAENGAEMLDLLDEKGRVIGTVQRSDAHGNPALRHPSVHIFVVNSKGEYFLQKRSVYKKIQPGKWDTSVGGHIPAGETYEQGALRELEEELGVSLPDASPLKLHHEFVWQSSFETEHTRTYILRYEGPFKLNPVEISEGRFWPVEELKKNLGKGILTGNLEAELKYLGIV